MTNQQNISCPICAKPNTWNIDNSFRPFCSARCKLIDLGEWANESRKIPGESAESNFADGPDDSDLP